MRQLVDSVICTLITLCMFAFPLCLLGLAPWFGNSLLTLLHYHPTSDVRSVFWVVLLMTASAAALLLLTFPTFAALHWPLARLARFGNRLLAGRPRVEVALELTVVSGPGESAAGVVRRPVPMPARQGRASAPNIRPSARAGVAGSGPTTRITASTSRAGARGLRPGS